MADSTLRWQDFLVLFVGLFLLFFRLCSPERRPYRDLRPPTGRPCVWRWWFRAAHKRLETFLEGDLAWGAAIALGRRLPPPDAVENRAGIKQRLWVLLLLTFLIRKLKSRNSGVSYILREKKNGRTCLDSSVLTCYAPLVRVERSFTSCPCLAYTKYVNNVYFFRKTICIYGNRKKHRMEYSDSLKYEQYKGKIYLIMFSATLRTLHNKRQK